MFAELVQDNYANSTHWWQTQSKNQDVSLVPPRVNGKLKPGAAMAIPPWLSRKKTVLAQASGPPTVGFAKAGFGLEHSETTSALKYAEG